MRRRVVMPGSPIPASGAITRCAAVFALCAGALLFGCAGAAEEGFAEPRDAPPEGVRPAVSPLLFLGPEDVIHVKLWPHEDIDRTVKADRQGYIILPLAGRINVAGQDLDWLRYVLSERFGEYYNDFEVMVDLVESPLQKAFVLGEVNLPGSYPITGVTSVLDLIAQAKGFNADANLEGVVLIRGDIQVPRVIPIDCEAALDGDLSQDYCLARGDIVYVNRTFIADLREFARRLTNIILPVHQTQRALVLGAMVPDAVLHGETRTKLTIGGGDEYVDPEIDAVEKTLPRSYRELREVLEKKQSD